MPWERRRDFERLAEALHSDLAPVGAMEEILAARIASLTWRLWRLGAIEKASLECGYVKVFNRIAAREEKRHEKPPPPPDPDFWAPEKMRARQVTERAAYKAAVEAPAPVKPKRWPFTSRKYPEDAARWFPATFDALEGDTATNFERLQKYAGSLEAQLYRALRELHRLQDHRAGLRTPSVEVAIDVRSDAGQNEPEAH